MQRTVCGFNSRTQLGTNLSSQGTKRLARSYPVAQEIRGLRSFAVARMNACCPKQFSNQYSFYIKSKSYNFDFLSKKTYKCAFYEKKHYESSVQYPIFASIPCVGKRIKRLSYRLRLFCKLSSAQTHNESYFCEGLGTQNSPSQKVKLIT
jgi:hypothetical protein